MHACCSLGPPVELFFGRERFVCVYTASAVVGTMASYAFNQSPAVGASGAAASRAAHPC